MAPKQQPRRATFRTTFPRLSITRKSSFSPIGQRRASTRSASAPSPATVLSKRESRYSRNSIWSFIEEDTDINEYYNTNLNYITDKQRARLLTDGTKRQVIVEDDVLSCISEEERTAVQVASKEEVKEGTKFQKWGSLPRDISPLATHSSSETTALPQNLTPHNLTPQNLSPQNLSPQNLSPQNLSPQNLSPQNLSPQNLSPQNGSPPDSPQRLSLANTPKAVTPSTSHHELSAKQVLDQTLGPNGIAALKHALIVALIAVLLGSLIYFSSTSLNEDCSPTMPASHSDPVVVKNTFQTFVQEITNCFRYIFPNQDAQLWKIVKSSFEYFDTKSNPLRPAVLLIASNKNSFSTTRCLANKLAEVYASKCSLAPFQLNGTAFRETSPGVALLQIDHMLQERIKSGVCVIRISNFEKIPAASTIILQQFLKGHSYLYRDLAMIITVEVQPGDWSRHMTTDTEIPVPKLWTTAVEQYLTFSLHSRDPITMNARNVQQLIASMTRSVVWVRDDHITDCHHATLMCSAD